jgi:hypothetical protein
MRCGPGKKEIERERVTRGPCLFLNQFKQIQIPFKLDLVQKGASRALKI